MSSGGKGENSRMASNNSASPRQPQGSTAFRSSDATEEPTSAIAVQVLDVHGGVYPRSAEPGQRSRATIDPPEQQNGEAVFTAEDQAAAASFPDPNGSEKDENEEMAGDPQTAPTVAAMGDATQTEEDPQAGNTGTQENGPSSSPRNTTLWIGVLVAVTIVLVVAIVVGGVCGSGNCGSSGTERSPPTPELVTGPPVPQVITPPSNALPPPMPVGGATVTNAPVPVPTTTILAPPTAAPVPSTAGKLESIVQGGQLACGVMDLPGQSEINSAGQRVGFSVDLCRAVAAALFGTGQGNVLKIVPVEATDRFTMLHEGGVDLLAASVTHTMERTVMESTTSTGFDFSTPYLYNGMTFGGRAPYVSCADSGNLTACGTLTNICVLDGTTYVDRIREILPDVAISLAPTIDAYYDNFRQGLCNVLAGDQFEVAPSAVQQRAYFGAYEMGQSLHTKEPIALVTTQEDATFSDFVNWVVQGLLAAEEQGFTQDRARFFKTVTAFGPQFETFVQNAVGEVGNYAEMYERNLASILPRSKANMINTGTSGLIYAMPFGNPRANGPGPAAGSTLREITDRGFLRCGVTRRAIFAEFDTTTQEWTGLDVDFCRALSAAVFDGVTNTIQYIVLPATERFLALASGQVDVLSRITTVTLSRDVLEQATMTGFSFSQPNFYDGLSFGGIPPYGACADRRATLSTECQELKICYNAGTTFEGILKTLFPERFLVARQSGDLVAEGLATDVCNAVAGGVVDVSASNIETIGGYSGPYETGSGRFSKDPLALVTRQDDPQWSAYVYWIVSAIFFAEEENIKSSNSARMPIVNLFGPLHTRIFRDAIRAVGSFQEIYERNVGEEVERGGLNSLNTNPLTAQHYPLPGL